MKYVYFYDLNEVLLKRYPAKISQELDLISSQKIKYIFIYSEIYSNNILNSFPKNSKFFYFSFLSQKKIINLFSKYPPSCLVTVGLRIPDMLMHSLFKKYDIPVFMVQHGIFIDHLTRIPFHKLLVLKFYKFIKYIIYTYSISKNINNKFFNLLIGFHDFFLKGRSSLKKLNINNFNNLISDYALIFDKSWIKYYQDKYGYSINKFFYIGNPDYLLIKNCMMEKEKKVIMYIAQTLVEDGRYLEKYYLNFLINLKSSLKNYKIYIKLHPRSNKKLYSIFENNNSQVNIGYEYINSDIVLGHYSSLLKIAKDFGKHLIIVRLKNHKLPPYFTNLVKGNVCNNFIDVKKSINFYRNSKVNYEISDQLNSYLKSTENSYRIIAKKILKFI